MTFSDPKVAEVVNANFVSAWFNRSAGFCNGDDAAEKSIFQHSSEAFLTKNICTFVLSPDGRVFTTSGYVCPSSYRFLEDALASAGGIRRPMRPARRAQAPGKSPERARREGGRASRRCRAPGHVPGVTHRHGKLAVAAREASATGPESWFWEKAPALPP